MIHFPGLPESIEPLLEPTRFLDWQHAQVAAFIDRSIAGSDENRLSQSIALFYAVRDRIRYDPYQIRFDDDAYRASQVIADGHGWCVSKAVLLAACLRAIGVPAAIGLADVKNHLTSEKLRKRMGGTDIFYDHGYVAAHINERWFKLVPAFNIELCERFGVLPTDFDGSADALYQQFDANDQLHMQYLADHGTWSDLPLQKVRDDFARHYPVDLVAPAHVAATPNDPFQSP